MPFTFRPAVNLNYGQLGGGTASQALAWIPDYSAGITALLPWGAEKYNSLQATLNRRFSNGLQFQAAYTFSKDISNVHFDSDPSVHQ